MNHLNLFEHYNQDNYSIPLENNLTRIFARILQSNYYFADSFYRFVDKKLQEEYCVTIYDEIEEQNMSVDIQRTIRQLKEDLLISNDVNCKKYIIGISLTAKSIDWKNEYKSSEATDLQKPDIYASFNNYHFIFEVKKTEENCNEQLNRYLKSLNAEKVVSVTWDDVVKILEKTMENGFGDIIINEYIEYIKNHFPKLFDYRSLKYCCSKETGYFNFETAKTMVENRFDLAFINMKKLDDGRNFIDVFYPYVLFKNNSFQQRIEVYVENNKLYFNTWLSDIKAQMYKFKEYYKNKNFSMKNKRQSTNLYVKFSNCGNWLYTFSLEKEYNNDIGIFDKLYEKTGRLKDDKLKESLKAIIEIVNSSVKIDNNPKVLEYINRKTVKDISVGICICDYIELYELVKEDTDNNTFDKYMKPQDDKVAQIIYKYIVDNLIYEE